VTPPLDSVPAQLRGFEPLGVLAILAILVGSVFGPPVSAVLVLVWAYVAELPLRDLGLAVPADWGRSLVLALLGGIFLKLVAKAIVMPLLGAPPVNVRYQYLAHNGAALPAALITVLVSAAFGEELFFRGYLFERLQRLLGTSVRTLVGIVLLTTALFALAHYHDQGLPGVEQAVVTGLVFGGVFAWRRKLPIVMVAHGAFDLTAVALIYWGWEAKVAHLIFH